MRLKRRHNRLRNLTFLVEGLGALWPDVDWVEFINICLQYAEETANTMDLTVCMHFAAGDIVISIQDASESAVAPMQSRPRPGYFPF